ncbi:MAG: hypothetical protein JW798_16585 [Prolixibacteraceae bacterium]|nr:hypothetical protein [Prolixibacteraceae bacterium]
MKTKHILFIAIVCCIHLCHFASKAQQPFSYDTNKLYLVKKYNGAEFLGKIKFYDARELLLATETIGEVYIPKHEIKEIREVNPEKYMEFDGEELFASRYFITTNGLPVKKGDNYILWNIYGPDFQFGIADNFGIGVMTSWAAIPIIATAKYSIPLGKSTNMALGALLGTGSWAFPDFGLALPFASFTFGNRRNNLTLSAGYGALFYSEERYNPVTGNNFDEQYSEGRVLLSIAGMAKISPKFSIVFDTFISPWGPQKTYTEWEPVDHYDPITKYYINTTYTERKITEQSPNLAIIMPGIRWQVDTDKAFQFGFTGFYFDNEFVPFPIPMIQWYRKL